MNASILNYINKMHSYFKVLIVRSRTQTIEFFLVQPHVYLEYSVTFGGAVNRNIG
jgi:hypothetical protein